jgi:hypothetical protein
MGFLFGSKPKPPAVLGDDWHQAAVAEGAAFWSRAHKGLAPDVLPTAKQVCVAAVLGVKGLAQYLEIDQVQKAVPKPLLEPGSVRGLFALYLCPFAVALCESTADRNAFLTAIVATSPLPNLTGGAMRKVAPLLSERSVVALAAATLTELSLSFNATVDLGKSSFAEAVGKECNVVLTGAHEALGKPDAPTEFDAALAATLQAIATLTGRS